MLNITVWDFFTKGVITFFIFANQIVCSITPGFSVCKSGHENHPSKSEIIKQQAITPTSTLTPSVAPTITIPTPTLTPTLILIFSSTPSATPIKLLDNPSPQQISAPTSVPINNSGSDVKDNNESSGSKSDSSNSSKPQ